MLSLLAALALCAADDLPQRLYDETHDGRWLDAADDWVRDRGELTPEFAAPEWLTRAALAIALELDHPELARPMRPETVPGEMDLLRDGPFLPAVLALSPGAPLDRWEAALMVRASFWSSGRSFQKCACLAAVLGGAAGRLVAAGCKASSTPATPGDRRAATLLATLRVPTKELLPFPTGTTPFERAPLEWTGAIAKTVDRAKLHLPPGFVALRAEQMGTELVVLAHSQQLEPAGELPGGAYWLLLGRNSQWREFYLGLRAHRPTVVSSRSRVPLLASDGLIRIEAVDQNLAGIALPGFALEEPGSPYLLVASVADVTRDTDHDGLTDLVESRLRLDPTLFDTDWDGLGDSEDSAPRLHQREAAAPALVAMAFERHYPSSLLLRREFDPRRPVTIIISSELAPPPLALGVRFVTLSPAELGASLFTDPVWFGPRVTMIVDESGDHAFVEWNESWRAVGVRIDRAKNGAITVKEVSGWIT